MSEQNKVIDLNRKKRNRFYFAWIDDETGEITGFSHPEKRMKNGLGGGWMAMYQRAMEWLAEVKLPQEQYRILFHLMSHLDFDNYLRVTQSEIAKKLEMNQPNVARAFRGLLERDIIRAGPKVGNARTYRLNPRMGMKGHDVKGALIEFDKLKQFKADAAPVEPVVELPPELPVEPESENCPLCGEELAEKANRSNGKKFLGCTGYPKCKFTKNV